MMNRRQFGWTCTSAGLALAAGPSLALARCTAVPDRKASPNEKSPAELITPDAKKAIERGLDYLASRQIRSGRNRGAFGNSGYACGVATASLGGLALMCSGCAPGQGKYGKQIDAAIEFVLSHVDQAGYINRTDNAVHENMYGHGFSMLFLSQAYGMTLKPEIGEKLRRAVRLTCRTQNSQGGWRYQPAPTDADLSITVCQIMGLRGARDAGIDVPDEIRQKCIEYVQKSQNRDGSFRYTMQGGHTTYAMTAAGVTSLYSAGIYEGPAVEKALKSLDDGGRQGGHYFYSIYYATQAMWHAGGEHWNKWYPTIRDELVSRQDSDGGWSRESEAGPEYGAAMACIVLQMPLNYLPVFSP
jgi:hypothetical protein